MSFFRQTLLPFAREIALPLTVGPTIAQAIRARRSAKPQGHREVDRCEKAPPQPPPTPAARVQVYADIEHGARSGFLDAGAFIERLHASHRDALAEEQRVLDGQEAELEARLRRWNSLYPLPSPPRPEPPAPPPVRRFGRLRDIWGSGLTTQH